MAFNDAKKAFAKKALGVAMAATIPLTAYNYYDNHIDNNIEKTDTDSAVTKTMINSSSINENQIVEQTTNDYAAKIAKDIMIYKDVEGKYDNLERSSDPNKDSISIGKFGWEDALPYKDTPINNQASEVIKKIPSIANYAYMPYSQLTEEDKQHKKAGLNSDIGRKVQNEIILDQMNNFVQKEFSYISVGKDNRYYITNPKVKAYLASLSSTGPEAVNVTMREFIADIGAENINDYEKVARYFYGDSRFIEDIPESEIDTYDKGAFSKRIENKYKHGYHKRALVSYNYINENWGTQAPSEEASAPSHTVKENIPLKEESGIFDKIKKFFGNEISSINTRTLGKIAGGTIAGLGFMALDPSIAMAAVPGLDNISHVAHGISQHLGAFANAISGIKSVVLDKGAIKNFAKKSIIIGSIGAGILASGVAGYNHLDNQIEQDYQQRLSNAIQTETEYRADKEAKKRINSARIRMEDKNPSSLVVDATLFPSTEGDYQESMEILNAYKNGEASNLTAFNGNDPFVEKQHLTPDELVQHSLKARASSDNPIIRAYNYSSEMTGQGVSWGRLACGESAAAATFAMTDNIEPFKTHQPPPKPVGGITGEEENLGRLPDIHKKLVEKGYKEEFYKFKNVKNEEVIEQEFRNLHLMPGDVIITLKNQGENASLEILRNFDRNSSVNGPYGHALTMEAEQNGHIYMHNNSSFAYGTSNYSSYGANEVVNEKYFARYGINSERNAVVILRNPEMNAEKYKKYLEEFEQTGLNFANLDYINIYAARLKNIIENGSILSENGIKNAIREGIKNEVEKELTGTVQKKSMPKYVSSAIANTAGDTAKVIDEICSHKGKYKKLGLASEFGIFFGGMGIFGYRRRRKLRKKTNQIYDIIHQSYINAYKSSNPDNAEPEHTKEIPKDDIIESAIGNPETKYKYQYDSPIDLSKEDFINNKLNEALDGYSISPDALESAVKSELANAESERNRYLNNLAVKNVDSTANEHTRAHEEQELANAMADGRANIKNSYKENNGIPFKNTDEIHAPFTDEEVREAEEAVTKEKKTPAAETIPETEEKTDDYIESLEDASQEGSNAEDQQKEETEHDIIKEEEKEEETIVEENQVDDTVPEEEIAADNNTTEENIEKQKEKTKKKQKKEKRGEKGRKKKKTKKEKAAERKQKEIEQKMQNATSPPETTEDVSSEPSNLGQLESETKRETKINKSKPMGWKGKAAAFGGVLMAANIAYSMMAGGNSQRDMQHQESPSFFGQSSW